MAGGQFGTSQVQLPLLEHIPAEFSRAAADVAADGFAVVRGFLGPEEMARVLAEVAAFERLVLPALPPHRAFFSDPDDLASLRFVGIASRIAQVNSRCGHSLSFEFSDPRPGHGLDVHRTSSLQCNLWHPVSH